MGKDSHQKILVTGGSGMVGTQIPYGIKPTHSELDITQLKTVQQALEYHRPTCLIHCAALTNIGLCEKNQKLAYAINVQGARNIARICGKKNIYLVYISTCVVFDGKKSEPYNEEDVPKPLNVYGHTKQLGEVATRTTAPHSLVVRTGWLFGGGPLVDKKFIGHAIQKLKNNEEVKAIGDRQGSPTYVPDFIKALTSFIEEKREGTIHIANSGIASYLEIAKIVKNFGSFSGKIYKVSSKEIDAPGVTRGKMEGLTSNYITLRNWQDALKEYLEKYDF